MPIKNWIILFFSLSISLSSTLAQDFAANNNSDIIKIIFNSSNNNVQLPNMILNGLEANRTFKNETYPIFLEHQKLIGTVIAPSGLAGKEVNICMSGFDVGNFLKEFVLPRKVNCRWNTRLNDSGIGSFKIPWVRGGFYALYAVEKNNSTLLSALPAIVALQDLAVDAPKKIVAGNVARVKMRTSLIEGRNLVIAALLIPEADYRNAMISVSGNGSTESLVSTITVDNRTMEIRGTPEMSPDFVFGLMGILPQNSAVEAQYLKQQSEVEFNLFTDMDWERGIYILTCAVLDPVTGLIAVTQDTIEIN